MDRDLFSDNHSDHDRPGADQASHLDASLPSAGQPSAKPGASPRALAAPKKPRKALEPSHAIARSQPGAPADAWPKVGQIVIPPAILSTLRLHSDEDVDEKRLHQIQLTASDLDPRGYGDWVEVVQIADIDLRSQELSIRAEQILKLASEAGMRRYMGLPDLEECQTGWLNAKNDYSHAMMIEAQIKDTTMSLPELQAETVAKLKDQGLGRSAIETMGLRSALPEYTAIHQLIASLQNRRQSQISDYRRRKEREAMATSPQIIDVEVE